MPCGAGLAWPSLGETRTTGPDEAPARSSLALLRGPGRREGTCSAAREERSARGRNRPGKATAPRPFVAATGRSAPGPPHAGPCRESRYQRGQVDVLRAGRNRATRGQKQTATTRLGNCASRLRLDLAGRPIEEARALAKPAHHSSPGQLSPLGEGWVALVVDRPAHHLRRHLARQLEVQVRSAKVHYVEPRLRRQPAQDTDVLRQHQVAIRALGHDAPAGVARDRIEDSRGAGFNRATAEI